MAVDYSPQSIAVEGTFPGFTALALATEGIVDIASSALVTYWTPRSPGTQSWSTRTSPVTTWTRRPDSSATWNPR